LDTLFDGKGHAPAPLEPEERVVGTAPLDKAVRWNLPDWLVPEFERSLGPEAEAAALGLQSRAPVTLRVNTAKITRLDAIASLQEDSVEAVANPLAETALTVVAGARAVRGARAYAQGLVELQDAASQAVVEGLPDAVRCLDYCAGGGGKALALSAQPGRRVHAHDIDSNRMANLEPRAARAGVRIPRLETGAVAAAAPYDLVLCDVPCSGSGAWRRSPEGKWRLTATALGELNRTQEHILSEAAGFLSSGGWLIYATCSVLRCENHDRVDAFLQSHSGWRCTYRHQYPISDEGDGFFIAHLTRV
jgi:16S rRNA (cytosine967-C5)-methyltransferase